MSKIYQGVVKMFNGAKGYGFIINNDNQNEHFVHISEIIDKGNDILEPGDHVEFAIGPGRNGKIQCVDVRIVE